MTKYFTVMEECNTPDVTLAIAVKLACVLHERACTDCHSDNTSLLSRMLATQSPSAASRTQRSARTWSRSVSQCWRRGLVT
jgi:hypothetical protein